jgi:YHS domain-containing protein
MTVSPNGSSHPTEYDGTTYYFCCVGCRDAFVADPASYVTAGSVGTTGPAHQEA